MVYPKDIDKIEIHHVLDFLSAIFDKKAMFDKSVATLKVELTFHVLQQYEVEFNCI